MILDDLADLASLAQTASSTASTQTDDAALADVEQRVNQARSLFASLGITHVRALQHLTGEERAGVVRAAKELRAALKTLDGATDAEIVAYASANADARGSLLVVSTGARALKDELLRAQRALLQRLSEKIWPPDDALRLDVIAHLSDRGTTVDAALRGSSTQERIAAILESDRGLPPDELDDLIEAAAMAAEACAPLRDESVPPEVLEFWREASSDVGVSLGAVGDAVGAWLTQHDALNSFTVRRVR